ncbi:hypothetical protein FNW25_15530 [Flavobacterium franklandianum]|uniref:hypothetical protein n=1 Tax=Flavobacterium franklandianum TaxID=2594430 RepID=UPI00117A35DC|nr:hypothetical protein [Flavobacterium franklandianum]TRX21850.1 hypothetical protein FNW25_15530 [Flavobacterium franklandianum]
MTQKDLNRIESLLTRTKNLPDILHLRASELGYKLTESDKELLLKTYIDLDDILNEVLAIINIKFPDRKDYVYVWNEIDFDTKIGGLKIHTTDREHTKREWKKGMFDLESLLKKLRNETILMIEDKTEKPNKPKSISTNNFNGNIVYAEGKIDGTIHQSSSQNKTIKTPAPTTATIKKILIGVFISVIGGLILWYLTTKS